MSPLNLLLYILGIIANAICRRGLKDRGDWVEGAVRKPGRVIGKEKKGVVGAVKEGVEKVLQVVRDEL